MRLLWVHFVVIKAIEGSFSPKQEDDLPTPTIKRRRVIYKNYQTTLKVCLNLLLRFTVLAFSNQSKTNQPSPCRDMLVLGTKRDTFCISFFINNCLITFWSRPINVITLQTKLSPIFFLSKICGTFLLENKLMTFSVWVFSK